MYVCIYIIPHLRHRTDYRLLESGTNYRRATTESMHYNVRGITNQKYVALCLAKFSFVASRIASLSQHVP